MDNKNIKKNKGFALIYSIIVSMIVLIVITSIVSLGIRQNKLSGISAESQKAFYSANTALECALYWDNHTVDEGHVVFMFNGNLRGEFVSKPFVRKNYEHIKCGRGSIVNDSIGKDGLYPFTINGNTTYFSIKTDAGYCANVVVEKKVNGEKLVTTITTKGYNVCDLDDPNALERGLVIQYET